ncbi:restriction endonuclease subunit S [Acinetobacter johnsonii]|uniref:Type-1 restriction enzyme EcoKI specificity protein n=2 Tax=Acinetobacter TaxID=469 RepID=A0A7S9DQD5_ACINO|nr:MULTISPECIES: restriction endonuclease subunit S [Acinetobacter]MDH1440239.1 restriction endonuclease subunit S [Acinetobacter johnsonii]MDH1490776.1 restriction endonuclease subunit S [Acinetobacter johnsonii]MDH1615867.1 restriction endonuclease subunit S [Acinetobacter johnsonii]MDH1800212.1 restriction endonuclease subunit S [Acinetobacter johnsonii]QEA26783.1 restriction endonuclease subunit S [Acinetobacter pittii]
MEFKQYPSYKKSGVEWLGDVPEHWESNRLKKYLIERNEKNSPIKTDNLLSVTMYQGVIPVSEKQGNGGNKPKENLENYKISYPNDIVLNSMNVIVGSVGLNKYTGLISPAYYALYNRNKNNNIKFFSYIFHNPFFQKGLFGLGNGIMYKESEDGKLNTIRLKIPMEKLNQVVLPCPSISEQNQIVAFLDTETARIDNLVAKQEKLIELLEEQRKSIISHAVTKGLNPNAPMKDSGVEWLGEVPNDWNFSRLDAVSKIVRGNSAFSKMDLLESGKYVALQYGKTYKVNEINESFGSYVNQEFFKKSQITEFGDIILISTSETLEDLGHSCFYARHDVGLIGGEQFLLKPKNQNFGKYIYYATKAFSSYLQRYATGLKVFRFNLDDLKKIYIPDISLVEQQKIAEFLDKETARIDISVLKQKSLIEKLKEYRASIISHAVTGKIDVREFGA